MATSASSWTPSAKWSRTSTHEQPDKIAQDARERGYKRLARDGAGVALERRGVPLRGSVTHSAHAAPHKACLLAPPARDNAYCSAFPPVQAPLSLIAERNTNAYPATGRAKALPAPLGSPRFSYLNNTCIKYQNPLAGRSAIW